MVLSLATKTRSIFNKFRQLLRVERIDLSKLKTV